MQFYINLPAVGVYAEHGITGMSRPVLASTVHVQGIKLVLVSHLCCVDYSFIRGALCHDLDLQHLRLVALSLAQGRA